MSCDGYADDNGEFVIEIRDYENSQVLGRLEIRTFKPFLPLMIEKIKGTER